MRVVIVSNRLPVKIVADEKGLSCEESVGGLATGIGSWLKSELKDARVTEHLWVGWPGISEEQLDRQQVVETLAGEHYSPVFLSAEKMESFYHGFCNATIWPLFHYFPTYATYHENHWQSYEEVNRIFWDTLERVLKPDDVVWIQDYHLMLLPRLLREKFNTLSIGFFLHIPFPSFEIFRLLPKNWRNQILEGLLGADLVGFHTHDYTQHFLQCVQRLLGYDHQLGDLVTESHLVKAGTFPMGIDFNAHNTAIKRPSIQADVADLKNKLRGQKVILSVDRLDYTKGILNRLEGFEKFLEQNPNWQGKVTFLLQIVESRINVEKYHEMKQRIDEKVGHVNGRFGTIGWAPIQYLYRQFAFESLVALYNVSDIALITPLRDGMNLVAKEYIASRADSQGALILSEFTGAAKEMGEAIIINPNNREEIAEAIKLALDLPREETVRRSRILQSRLKRYDVFRWVKHFFTELADVKKRQTDYEARLVTPSITAHIAADFNRAARKLVLLDYDGTLTNFTFDPKSAGPSESLLTLLQDLQNTPGVTLVLVSGRDRHTLQHWFGHLDSHLVAEHGTWKRAPGEDWIMSKPLSNAWISKILPILETYSDYVPGSFIEEKEFSLSWHYRKVYADIGAAWAQELMDHLTHFTANLEVQIMLGNKVIEIKNAGVNKGEAALELVATVRPDFILAIGDDTTDEDMFKTLPNLAYTLKVGMTKTHARYNFRRQADVTKFLYELSGHGS